MRSRGRCSGSGRRAGLRVLPDRSARSGVGAAISAAASSSATPSSSSASCSSSCSISLAPRSEDWPNCSRRILASSSLQPLDLQPGARYLGLGIPGPRLGLEPGCALGQDHGVRSDEIGGQWLAVD